MGLQRRPTALLTITIFAIASSVLEQQLQLASAQTCGYQAHFLLCPNNQCCSQSGYCAHTPQLDAYCGYRCQSGGCHGTEPPPAVIRNIGRGRVLFDYIGSSGRNIFFTEYPVNTSTTITYVLGLSFAIDMNSTGDTQNGNFQVHWSSDLTPETAKAWRARYPNVRISIVLGGSVINDTQGNQHSVDWYNPPNQTQWLANALSSLTNIVQTYGADGIDIHIERFPNGNTSFLSLIGSLVTTLRRTRIIRFASLAPGYDQLDLYSQLYKANPNNFDILNYQFYREDLNNVTKYMARYEEVIQKLPAKKLGLSTKVSWDIGTISGTDFYAVVKAIRRQKGIAGVTLWNADLSKHIDNFGTEKAISGFL